MNKNNLLKVVNQRFIDSYEMLIYAPHRDGLSENTHEMINFIKEQTHRVYVDEKNSIDINDIKTIRNLLIFIALFLFTNKVLFTLIIDTIGDDYTTPTGKRISTFVNKSDTYTSLKAIFYKKIEELQDTYIIMLDASLGAQGIIK